MYYKIQPSPAEFSIFPLVAPVTLDAWDAGTALDYPNLIDQDFGLGWGSVHHTIASFVLGSGSVPVSFRVTNLSTTTHDSRWGFPQVTTTVSDLQFVVTYTTTPEPGTWIAGIAIAGLWLKLKKHGRDDRAF